MQHAEVEGIVDKVVDGNMDEEYIEDTVEEDMCKAWVA